MTYRFPIVRYLAVVLVAAAAGSVVLSLVEPAAAQERVERKSFLQLLFGSGKTTKPEAEKPAARTSRVKKVTRRAAPVAAPEPTVEKLENARKILVLGDFLANGTADGLGEAFEQAPGVVVIDRTNGSSGLVRDDFYNWPEEARAIVEEVEPSVIVVQLGSNDRQQLLINGERENVGSANWLTEYERRTEMLISSLRTRNAPVLWMGVPAFKSPSMTTDMVALNGVFRKQIGKAGGEFIDIWDGFVDEEGKFVFTGSDINGQQVRLRGSDGINVTGAGRRKMAFYAEKSIRRLLGNATSEDIVALDSANFPEIFMPPPPGENAVIVRTLPVAMTDPDLDGGTALLGEMPATASLIRSPRDKLVIDGVLTDAPEGRVDNFTWPRVNR